MFNWVKVKQVLPGDRVADVALETRNELVKLSAGVKKEGNIGVAVGSRGIANLAIIVREAVRWLKEAGARPFIIPAMGSHGGATAEGQIKVLNSYGISEEEMGCPIHSSMEVEQVGTTPRGLPVFWSKTALEADQVLLINKIKPHMLFSGAVESGLIKMLVIGLGKHRGALALHQSTIEYGTGSELLLEAAAVIKEKASLLGGIGLIENGYDQTAQITALKAGELEEKESLLLQKAREMLPRIPIEYLDLLIVDEMGKDISGAGMDPNVLGRKGANNNPRITRIFVRDLTDVSAGNAIGLGRADFTTSRLVNKINRYATYTNALTAMRPTSASIPIYFDTDREVLDAVLLTLGGKKSELVEAAWIRNTLSLSEFWVSERVAANFEDKNVPLEIISKPYPMQFDDNGNLLHPLP